MLLIITFFLVISLFIRYVRICGGGTGSFFAYQKKSEAGDKYCDITVKNNANMSRLFSAENNRIRWHL